MTCREKKESQQLSSIRETSAHQCLVAVLGIMLGFQLKCKASNSAHTWSHDMEKDVAPGSKISSVRSCPSSRKPISQ